MVRNAPSFSHSGPCSLPTDPPVFTGPWDVFLLEDTPVNSKIVTLTAQDEDSGDVLRYEPSSQHLFKSTCSMRSISFLSLETNDFFTVDESSGNLFLKHPLDFESANIMDFHFQISDGRTSTAGSIRIAVGDVNGTSTS